MDKFLNNLKPSTWIMNQINALKIRRKINILDFASGNGRHAINLSKNYSMITAIDKDIEKLNLYKNIKNIKTICFDLETNEDWPLEKESFDIIIVTNYLYRPRIKDLASFLKKGGFLFYETFAVGNENYGRPVNPNYLLKDKELIDIFKDKCKIIYYFQGKVVNEKTSIIQRCSLKKKAS